jgi:hypothetical protein
MARPYHSCPISNRAWFSFILKQLILVIWTRNFKKGNFTTWLVFWCEVIPLHTHVSEQSLRFHLSKRYILFWTCLWTLVFYNTHLLFKFQNRCKLGRDKQTAETPLERRCKSVVTRQTSLFAHWGRCSDDIVSILHCSFRALWFVKTSAKPTNAQFYNLYILSIT